VAFAKFPFVTIVLFVSSLAFSNDIYTRINNCESSGGGTCVFDLLRELAGRGGNQAELPLQPGLYRQQDGSYYLDFALTGANWLSWAIRAKGGNSPETLTRIFSYRCEEFVCTTSASESILTVISETEFRYGNAVYKRI
jgi:hypothetical protein